MTIKELSQILFALTKTYGKRGEELFIKLIKFITL